MEGKGIFVPPAKDVDWENGNDSAERETLEIYHELANHLALSRKLKERLQDEKIYADFIKKISKSFAENGVDTELGVSADEINQEIEKLTKVIERVDAAVIKLLREKNLEELILEKGKKAKDA